MMRARQRERPKLRVKCAINPPCYCCEMAKYHRGKYPGCPFR